MCNNCKCKLEEHEVEIPSKTRVPKKFVKKKIIVDEGGRPNYPDKRLSLVDPTPQAAPSLPSLEDQNDAEFPPPFDGEGVSGAHNGMKTSNPLPENVRNSFTFLPDGANEETVSSGMFNPFRRVRNVFQLT